jgi:hypothetical protein
MFFQKSKAKVLYIRGVEPASQTAFRIEENIDILTVFPQLLTENGPKYGKTVKLGSKTILGWTTLL